MKKIILTAIFLAAAVLATSAQAAQVTLAWDPNAVTPDGYRLFIREAGQEYDYSWPIWEGAETTHTITGLEAGKTYYSVVRAFMFNEFGENESENSNEAMYRITPPNSPPIESANIPAVINSGESVIFDGSESYDPEGEILVHEWEQRFPSTAMGSFDFPYSSVTTFTAPIVSVDTEIIIFHKVTDPVGDNAAQTKTVLITAETTPPLAVIENGETILIKPKGPFTLSGLNSSPAGGTFIWQKTSGLAVTLSNENSGVLTVNSPVGAFRLYVFQLTYTVNGVSTSTSITVKCIQ